MSERKGKKKEARRDGKIIEKRRSNDRDRELFSIGGRKNCWGTREKLVKIFMSMGIFGDDEARFTWQFFLARSQFNYGNRFFRYLRNTGRSSRSSLLLFPTRSYSRLAEEQRYILSSDSVSPFCFIHRSTTNDSTYPVIIRIFFRKFYVVAETRRFESER